METKKEHKLKKNIRRMIAIFIILLVLSGITAFPLEWELSILVNFNGPFHEWISRVYHAVQDVNSTYPFIAYGTDWLAFAHLVIATAFFGPYKDPVRNKWVIQFGMIACLMVIPLALICGHIRHIPFQWQLIDCAFGIFGIIPLYYCHQKIKKLDLIYNTIY